MMSAEEKGAQKDTTETDVKLKLRFKPHYTHLLTLCKTGVLVSTPGVGTSICTWLLLTPK